MDIINTSINWVKDELFSTPFFIVFGLSFVLASIGFWQLGKTDLAKAYIIPTLIAGTLLIIIGTGLFVNNWSRLNNFESTYKESPQSFIISEIGRTQNTLKEYQTVVFKIIPIIIVISSLILIFINTPMWRAISTTVIAMMVVILIVDGIAQTRIVEYHKKLLIALENENIKDETL